MLRGSSELKTGVGYRTKTIAHDLRYRKRYIIIHFRMICKYTCRCTKHCHKRETIGEVDCVSVCYTRLVFS